MFPEGSSVASGDPHIPDLSLNYDPPAQPDPPDSIEKDDSPLGSNSACSGDESYRRSKPHERYDKDSPSPSSREPVDVISPESNAVSSGTESLSSRPRKRSLSRSTSPAYKVSSRPPRKRRATKRKAGK